MNGNIVSNGQPPPDEEERDEPKGDPDDKAGAGADGGFYFRVDGVRIWASFRAWMVALGVSTVALVIALLKLVQTLAEIFGDHKK